MQDVFTPYETGLTHLLRRLGKDHPRYTEALTLQSRLLENIVQARRYGDTETRRAERAQIVEQLNTLALDALGKSFNELCGLAQEAGVLAMASLAGTLSIASSSLAITTSFTWAVPRPITRLSKPRRCPPTSSLARM